MKRFVLTPLVVAVALAAGAVGAQEAKDAQSYGIVESEGATYEEPIAESGDAYAQVYGDGRADDYHDYGDYRPYDERYRDGVVSGVAGGGSGAAGEYEPLIVPDRHGRDGEFAMARVLRVDPLVSRGCTDTRYAGEAPYRGEPVYRDGDAYGDGGGYEDDRYAQDGYRSGDDGYRGGGYPDDGYSNDGYSNGGYPDGYGNGGYADPYGRPPPRSTGVGAAIGAIIGGVIGNEIVDDDHGYYGYSGERAAATMVGALLGGAVGAGIEREVVRRREQQYYGQQYRGQRAVGVDGGHVPAGGGCEGVGGYRVTYEYAGRRYEAVTDYDPGDELRVRIEMQRRG